MRPPCTRGRGGGGRKLGRRGSRQRVGPSRLLFLRLDWLSGAVEPPPGSFIRSEKGGDGNPHSFIPSSLQLLIPSLHLPWRKGILVLHRWRRGSLLGSAPLLPLHPRWRSQP